MSRQKLLCPFSHKFQILIESSMVPQPADLLKIMLNLVCVKYIQMNEHYFVDLIKYTFNICFAFMYK